MPPCTLPSISQKMHRHPQTASPKHQSREKAAHRHQNLKQHPKQHPKTSPAPPSILQKCARTFTSMPASTQSSISPAPQAAPQTAPSPAPQTARPLAPAHQSRKSLLPLFMRSQNPYMAFSYLGKSKQQRSLVFFQTNPKNDLPSTQKKTHRILIHGALVRGRPSPSSQPLRRASPPTAFSQQRPGRSPWRSGRWPPRGQ